MSRYRMIFWAVVAISAILLGISARNNDLRLIRRSEIMATDHPEKVTSW